MKRPATGLTEERYDIRYVEHAPSKDVRLSEGKPGTHAMAVSRRTGKVLYRTRADGWRYWNELTQPEHEATRRLVRTFARDRELSYLELDNKAAA